MGADQAIKRVDQPLPWLGGLSAAQFMRRHWQKKPLLIRQAFPNFKTPISIRDVLALSSHEAAASRLVRHQANGSWTLKHGPLKANAIPSLKTPRWTVLVQQVNTLLPAADRFLDAFRFIPQARLDDLMVSVAGPDGGIGAHTDSYDVFLLQASGQRRWEIASQFDATLCDDMPLKMLKHFKPQESWVLDPGDMLYLPPHVAHRGTAVGEGCMTWSVGFRAPNRLSLADSAWAQHLDGLADADWQDPWLTPTIHPAEIPERLLAAMAHTVRQSMPSQAAIETAVCRVLSDPAAQAVFYPPARPDSLAAFCSKAAKRGLALAGASRLLYLHSHFFINGEALAPIESSAWILLAKRLANQRQVTASEVQKALKSSPLRHIGGTSSESNQAIIALHEMYLAGWIVYD